MNTFTPSVQQQAFFDWVRQGSGSAIVIAVAGAGKTTTCARGVALMGGSVFFGAYNKSAAVEIEHKLTELEVDLRRVHAGTMHSAGFRAWRRVAPQVRVDDRKVGNLFDQAFAHDLVGQTYRNFVLKLVSLAKQRAVGFMTPVSDSRAWFDIVTHFGLEDDLAEEQDLDVGLNMARTVYQRSLDLDREVIDFDDMILAPLVHRAKFWGYDWVVIDEAQDTNPARRALARALLKKGGRFVAVGDPHQAIYGFTGADSDSLDLLKSDFHCLELPLTTTYRCPKAVVQLAQRWVNHIEAADTAPDGVVRAMSFNDLAQVAGSELRPTDAILCRNTAPLVSAAYMLIRRQVACVVEGREIGRGLTVLAQRWKVRTLSDLITRLTTYQEKEIARWLAKNNETKAAAVEDRVQTLLVMIDFLLKEGKKEVSDLVAMVETMFADTNGEARRVLTLSTVHKSKGREWDRVYILGMDCYMPSPWARKEWQKRQENNLCYVAVTRAKRELVLVNFNA